LDGHDSTDFAMLAHIHDDRYYTETESDARFALISHTHLPGDADTLDGLDSTEFALSSHTHDTRYYQRSEADANFLNLGGGTLTGDLNLPNLYASGVISGNGNALTNLNASRIITGTIGLARLPPNIDADTLDGFDSPDFAMAVHNHDASDITSGSLGEARLPQFAIDNSEIEVGFGLVPSGTIVMWNGTTIPNGWALCDGTNGTPDLRGMFIAGYDPTDSDYNITGNIGGEKAHTLTTSEMPSHQHSFSGSTSMNGNHQHTYEDRYWDNSGGGLNLQELSPNSNGIVFTMRQTEWSGDHSHTFSGNTNPEGGGAAHENRPPYYVLAFIMKL
jgi:microcystin-dependent protein